MVKYDICLGDARKQNALFSKNCTPKMLHAPIAWSRPCLFIRCYEILHGNRNLETEKNCSEDFLEKVFWLKMDGKGQK